MNGQIELYEDDPAMIDLLLCYLYTRDYDTSNNGLDLLVTHVHIYAIADKCGVSILKALAEHKICSALKGDWGLDISDFVAAIKLIYTINLASDRGLRDCIQDTLLKYVPLLRESKDFVKLIKSGRGDGDVAIDVIIMVIGLPNRGIVYDDYYDA